MEGKWTKGEWLMADKPSSVVGWPVVQQGTGRVICRLNYIQHTQIDPKVPGNRAFNAESRANGKLIAQAPAMAEALEDACREAGMWLEHGDPYPSRYERARALLTAIKGE